MADREKFVKCGCHGEGILVTKFDDEEEMYFSYWREGINPVKLSLWMRLKLCYLALFKGNYYDDQVILNKEKAMELALWIQDEHDHVTAWVREMDKEAEMDKTRSEDEAALLKAVFTKRQRPPAEDSHGDWENEGGSNLK